MTTTNPRGVVGRGLGTGALPELPQTPAGSPRRAFEGRTTGVESGNPSSQKRPHRLRAVEAVMGMAGMSPEVGRVGPGTGEPSRGHDLPEDSAGATGDVGGRGWSLQVRELEAVPTVAGAWPEMRRSVPSTGELDRARQAQISLCRAQNRGRAALFWFGCQGQMTLFVRLVRGVIRASRRQSEGTVAIGGSTSSSLTCPEEFSVNRVAGNSAPKRCSSICQGQICTISERPDHLLLDPDAGPQQTPKFFGR